MKLIETETNGKSAKLFKQAKYTHWQSYRTECGMLLMFSEGPRDGKMLSISWVDRPKPNEIEVLELKLRFFQQGRVKLMPMIHSRNGFYIVELGQAERQEGIAEAIKKESPTIEKLDEFVDKQVKESDDK